MLSFVTFFKVLQIFGLQFSPSHYAFAATVCDGASCANDEADTTQTFFIQKRAGLVGKHDVKKKDAEVENAHLEKIIRDAEMQDPTCKFETLICGCGGGTPPPTPVPPTPVPPTPSPTQPPMSWVYADGDFTEASGGIQLAQPGHSHDGAVTQQESAAWTAAYFTLADGPASFEFSCTASTDDNLHVGLTSRQQDFETRQHWADVEYAAECHYGRQNGVQAIQFWWTQYSDSGLDLQNRQPGNIEGPWNESTRIKIAYEADGRVHGYVDDVEYITYDVYNQDVAGQGYTELMPALVGRVTGHGILNAVWTTPTPLTALNQRNNHLRELVKEKETQDPRCLLPDMICGCADGPATPPPTPSPTPPPTPSPTPAPTPTPTPAQVAVYGYSVSYKSTHQIDDIYFSKDGDRTIPVMTSANQEGCALTQGGSCNGGVWSPWGPSGSESNSGCWSFNTHSILCDHPITADKVDINFWNAGYSSTSGFTVSSLDQDDNVMEEVYDGLGTRSEVGGAIVATATLTSQA